LRVRLPQVLEWIDCQQPDVLALQETKLVDEHFPVSEIDSMGYHAVFSGQKTYNGVAVLSKKPGVDTVKDIPGLTDPQRRILEVSVGDIRLLNLYVVNGSELGSDKYRYKLFWLDKVISYMQAQVRQHPYYVVLGDFNIAPEDRDVYDPKLWRARVLCSRPERQALQRMLELGFKDTFRLFQQKENSFSWWDYRTAAFRRNAGLRIDLILASGLLSAKCVSSEIDKGPRSHDRPSDHAPIIATFT
jgi:exodeoxyribonuclease-3